jgi:hypothetical protein
LLILEPEKAECSPPSEGLTILYAGDGTLNDSAGICPLDRHGNVTFAPGKVGQAFFFNGDNSFLATQWTGDYEFGSQDATITLYVKFTELQGERTLVSRLSEKDAGWRLAKSPDDHIEFRKAGSTGVPNVVKSETGVHENTWYHVVVTKSGQRVAIYVNGLLQGTSEFSGTWQYIRDNPLYLGATPKGRTRLRGLLDEVAFYNRALTPKEIQALYDQREKGPCKL